MRIAVVGAGPGGLYLAALCKQLDPTHEITVWERNAPDDTFGFGVVFSDETLGGIEHADPAVFAAMQQCVARWDDIDVHFGGTVTTSGGHGFSAMGRKELLGILQRRCAEVGVTVHYRTEAPDVATLRRQADLVIAADGANSRVRQAGDFGGQVETGRSRYMWLGTDRVFEAFTFDVRETQHGVMQLHGYPYSAGASTVIIEMHDDVWQRAFAPIAELDLAPGENDVKSIAAVKDLFADLLGEHALVGNNSKWLAFPTVTTRTWRDGNVVLLGDAAHTAHFSIGSGTKLAMEDALALAACLHEEPDLDRALDAYEQERRPVVASTQRAAKASREWFEEIGHYTHQDPAQFAFNIVTRSRRVTHDNLRVRDPEFVAATERWFTGGAECPPMFQPYRLGELELRNRVIVSPMDMYVAKDGLPGDFHLVHLGSKALGGAGLVMTEMVCVSPEGRITPGCAGIYTPEQEAAWKRVADFVHEHSDAKVGMQIGHSGRKGSTKLMWEGIDEPLPAGGWDVVGPSPLPYSPDNAVPRQLTRSDLLAIREQFIEATRAAARAGFDALELHCAHGYLLSSFLSPLSNQRTDGYGGSLERRLRFPLEVFDAVRAAWPAERPVTVRISATDWHEGGNDVEEAVAIARAFAEHGAAGIDVSTGQVTAAEQPAFGRSYQTPYADRIRNDVGRSHGVAVIAVGAISSWDDVNSILLAGRADLCALGRPHLYDPHWTLHAAAEQGFRGAAAEWPKPFAAGSRRPQTGRLEGPRPRLDLVRRGEQRTRHARWSAGQA
ncbi:bifunctional salicylyl-CoA 5-hydroxylase/oxidoreductase [Pseudonocardia sp. TRM90224]|uniref:bifunctional salicylyl-CoA 5-hydroxylase/oxidoreductase n=1 Tax=Pseudonocardia sp. TRM90224 TaxID=2812678 RepID=UPI001E4662FC|nr:bifunctional salicylyl-CoA 5-hydroxylase/oxidoreductase [Pseudonocardia sp. TRM90224]